MEREGSSVSRASATGRTRTPKSARRRLGRRQTQQHMHGGLAEFDARLQYQNVMKGKTEQLPPMNSRVVRIFLSSTFSDMAAERNLLVQHVNPKLKKFCRDNFGLEFQTIDMRWGVGDDVQLDHQGPSICLQEVDNCENMSGGLYFICLLGQRYGNRPAAAVVEAEVFDGIVEALEATGRDTALLREWYALDANSQPPVRVLRPICSLAEAADAEKLRAAKSRWWDAQDDVIELLGEGARECHRRGRLSQSKLKNFTSSVTEMEVASGILQKPHSKLQQTLAFVREFADLTKQSDFSKGKIFKFIDLKDDVDERGQPTKAVDADVYSQVQELNREVLSRMGSANAFTYSLQWSNDKDGVGTDSHADYLSKFADDYCGSVQRLVRESVRESLRLRADDLYSEVLQHSTACLNYVKKFQGRQEIVDQIRAYVQADRTEPLVVFGDSGSGKTSLLGKAASLVRTWLPDADSEEAVVLLRFLGTSPGTSSIRQTLKFLCRQLAEFGSDDDRESCAALDDFKEILNTFYSMLERMGEFRRIVVFLDSIDQLDSTDGAFHLTWVRTPLPANVKMVVSTLPHMFDLLKTFKGRLPSADNYVEVTPMETSLCTSILSALLQEQGRTLNSEQWRLVESAFHRCSLPIYVHLLYHQVLRWRSFHPVDESALRYSVREAIFHLFENLELKHGKTFTSHALAFITASRNGLSETELEDVLSLDDTVLADVFQHHLPPFIRIPPICWARLRNDIGSYLVEREADSIRVVFWYHRQFIEVAHEYFLSDDAFRRSIHSLLADYFLGLWSGRKKKFVYPAYIRKKMNLDEFAMEDRSVPEQPFVLRTDASGERQFNLRKLNELPWHLIKAERLEEFYDYVVFDYDFMYNKLSGTSRYLLLRDLDLPLKLGLSFIHEAELVYNAIRLAAQSLVYDAANLSVDLVGRLLTYENESPRVKLLLDQCRQSQRALASNCLIPRVQCFDSGSGLLYSSFDLGLGMGIVMPNGNFVVFSLINNEVTWFDIEGNEIKRFSSDYNLFLSMKYLSHNVIPDDCVVNAVSVRAKGVQEGDMEGELSRYILRQLQFEIDEYEACGKEVPAELRADFDKVSAGEVSDELVKRYKMDIKLKNWKEEQENDQKGQDLIRVDFLNGRVTKLGPIKSEWKITSDDIENVAQHFILACKDKSDSTGKCKLSLASMEMDKKLQLVGEETEVTSRLGTQFMDSDRMLLCFAYNNDASEDVIVFFDLLKQERRECELKSCLKAMSAEELKAMITIVDLNTDEEKEKAKGSDKHTDEGSDKGGDEESDKGKKETQDELQQSVEHLLNGSGIKVVSCLMDADQNIVCIANVMLETKKESGFFITLSTKDMRPIAIVDTRVEITAKYSQNFLSKSKSHMVFLMKMRSSMSYKHRGLIFDCGTGRPVTLIVPEEKADFRKSIKAFGDGTQAKFTEDERLLLTSGTKVLLLVWSVQSGQLLHGIAYGSAESFLGGQPRGTDFFTICHFPDESAPSEDERMFIMTKVYNLKYFYDQMDQEESKMLPAYMQSKKSCCYRSDTEPTVVGICGSKDFRLDTSSLHVSEIGEQSKKETDDRVICEEPLRIGWRTAGEWSEIVLYGDEVRKTLGENPMFSFSRGDENPHSIVKFVDLKRMRFLQSPISATEKLRQGVGWLLEDQRLLIHVQSATIPARVISLRVLNLVTLKLIDGRCSMQAKFSEKFGESEASAKSLTSENFVDLFADVIFNERKPKLKKKQAVSDDEEEKEGVDVHELSEEEKEKKLEKFMQENWTSKQELVQVHLADADRRLLLALSQKYKPSERIRSGVGVPPIWLGCVFCFDYGAAEAAGSDTVEATRGKIFDMGPAVAFLNDGQHLVNYKLQLVHCMSGCVVRNICDNEDDCFVRLQATPDCSLVVGQVFFPAYEVEFAVFDDESNDSEMFAILPPRCLRVYRLSDGQRLANYLFENDPFGFCLVGDDGRDLLVVTHNSPIMLFSLRDPPQLQQEEEQQQQQQQQQQQSSENSDTTSQLQISVRRAPGPKPEYLERLAPALTAAMAEVVNARPVDPIRFLAEALMRMSGE